MGILSTYPTIAGQHHLTHEPGGEDPVAGVPPGAHAATHEPAGADEVNDIDIANTGVLLSAHAARHQDGGADELDVSELAGALGAAGEIPETDGAAVTWVDPDGRYAPLAHAASHLDGAADEIDAADLSGAGGAAGEIIETDGADLTYVDPDGRYAPAAHAASHLDGAADEIDAADLAGTGGAAGEIIESDGAALSYVEPDGRYAPAAHAASHLDGAADEIDVADLAGTGGAAGEIVETDGNALSYVEPDGRYAPAAHASTHESGGSDETRNIEFNPGLADETGSGDLALVTVGEAVVTGDTLTLKTGGKYWKTDANAVGTMPAEVIVIDATIAQDATGTVMHEGYYRNDDLYNFTIGDGQANLLFADVNPGLIVQFAGKPAGAGDLVQVVGWAVTDNVIYWRPSLELVELS